jgi:hypothetical protein
MTEQRRFGETDHEPLQPDDILAQAIGRWREELPSRELWPGVAERIAHQPAAPKLPTCEGGPASPELRRSEGGPAAPKLPRSEGGPAAPKLPRSEGGRQSTFTFTLSQLAVAASLLVAVASGLTWLATNRPALTGGGQAEDVIQAYREPQGTPEPDGGQILQANFADAQFNAAVSDLERILREERDRLDPRTVLVLERNLKAIDAAISEARMALDQDPANPFLNSHLADARRRKIDLLRHAASIASASGD